QKRRRRPRQSGHRARAHPGLAQALGRSGRRARGRAARRRRRGLPPRLVRGRRPDGLLLPPRSPTAPPDRMIRAAAGRVAVATLKRLARLPVPLAHALGLPLIPFYLLLRPGMWRRLAQAAPAGAFKPVFALTYYSMRLRLVLL